MGFAELDTGTEALRFFSAPHLDVALRFVRRHLRAEHGERALHLRTPHFPFELTHPVSSHHSRYTAVIRAPQRALSKPSNQHSSGRREHVARMTALSF